VISKKFWHTFFELIKDEAALTKPGYFSSRNDTVCSFPPIPAQCRCKHGPQKDSRCPVRKRGVVQSDLDSHVCTLRTQILAPHLSPLHLQLSCGHAPSSTPLPHESAPNTIPISHYPRPQALKSTPRIDTAPPFSLSLNTSYNSKPSSTAGSTTAMHTLSCLDSELWTKSGT
jgi:hypothetical protein